LIKQPSFARPIALFLAATLVLRLVAIFATGFCDDEAYVIAISRTPALSYFDHPPLHQWILTAWVAAFGESRAARLPYFGCSLVTAVALFFIARRLFSDAAAWWTAFAFAASAYFLVYPDGYIMPDPPLLMFSALAVWAAAEILFGPPGRETLLWLGVGVALGLAGLAKYSAIFTPLGLFGFFMGSPRARRWLADVRPYIGAVIALLCLTPALIWNAEHGWVSLAFQSGRAANRLTLSGKALGQIVSSLGEQLASVTPWMLWPLIAGLARGFRRGADSPERFLLWLAGPALVLFTLMPLLGVRPISHWFNSGWLFAFPLAGAWLADRTRKFQRGFLRLASSLALVVFAGYLAAVLLGPIEIRGVRDPTRGMFDFPAAPLREAYARSGADFALIENWRLGGRIGVALGPNIPVCAMGSDPRGFAFSCDLSKRTGQAALIIRAKDNGRGADEKPFFASVEPLGDLAIGRRGRSERLLTLEKGIGLIRAPPLPYGP
jgi:4-amino-4-deoxy-L-arabinose transferase-like glycosyltransferase